ncbi:hypothetical protein AQJ91_44715 [Streptomyces dysideae]|uniref:DUF5753 domain-containing protein n=1 Tax=Streptomyces dysideae TaxID=909626 RepID=A0A117RXE8_9ACTN|nr:hypothetical protein AQJ91_44715 [Streptomyces dysideae]
MGPAAPPSASQDGPGTSRLKSALVSLGPFTAALVAYKGLHDYALPEAWFSASIRRYLFAGLCALGADHAFVEALVGVATDKTFGWWESYREVLPSGLLDLAELEHHATAVRTAYTSHMPGLLQTADHAREIFQHVIPASTPPEVEHRVSHRIKRGLRT